MWLFADRQEAGRRLAARLASLRGEAPIVLALPRGGLPVAAEVADQLGAPLDVIVVRKLGAPYQPELGLGAVGEDGALVMNADVLRASANHLGVREASRLEESARRGRTPGDEPAARTEDVAAS
jgi:predicted phosphoribosyltransferase